MMIYDRKAGRVVEEKIFGESGVRFLYGNPLGGALESALLCRPWFSKLYGAYQSSGHSARGIDEFVRKFEIPMEEYEPGPFPTFNEFFIRKLKPGVRAFETDPNRFSAPAEGRYLVFPSVGENTPLPVKGATLNARALLGIEENPEEASRLGLRHFVGGPGFIARLCPVDYHRFHFPDSGKVIARFRRRGSLRSVNPIALAVRGDLLFRNEREVSILETKNFGRIAYVEVGAICVGKIVQSHPDDREFERGDEKGYFLFGGSTVIVIGEKGGFEFDEDLLDKSKTGVECLVRLGEGIATRVKKA
jgi:phosphatidylserine decarboxylase